MTFQIAGIDTCGLQGASRPHLTLSTISWNMTFGQFVFVTFDDEFEKNQFFAKKRKTKEKI